MSGKKYIVILIGEFFLFLAKLMTRISISGLHNNSQYPLMNFINIRAVGKSSPEYYARR